MPGSIPYQQAVPSQKEIPSIASELKNKGIMQVQFMRLIDRFINVKMYIKHWDSIILMQKIR